MSITSSGYPPCYLCGVPTPRIVSITTSFPSMPAGPRDIIAICPGCGDAWNFALTAPVFCMTTATFVASASWLKGQRRNRRNPRKRDP